MSMWHNGQITKYYNVDDVYVLNYLETRFYFKFLLILKIDDKAKFNCDLGDISYDDINLVSFMAEQYIPRYIQIICTSFRATIFFIVRFNDPKIITNFFIRVLIDSPPVWVARWM